MPIRKNILRKGKAPKQNLLEFDVFQEETGVLGDLSTSRFFKISEFPSVLPTGNSSFLIEGSDLLKPNVELKTELLDSAGNPIFHYAIPNYDKELPARRITIEVYFDDVVNGIGSFTALGELDPRKIEVPTAFQNTYNIRFSAPISINKNIKNTRPIRFYGDPRLTVSEQVKSVVERVPTGGVKTKTITGSVSLIVSTPSTADYGAVGSTTADSTQIEEVGNNQSAYISQNIGEAQSSILGNSAVSSKPFVTYVVEEMEKGIDNELGKITSAMQGGTLSINRPDLLVDASIYPNAKFTKPTTFSTKILKVLNSTTFTTTTQYKIKSKLNDQELIVPLNASSSGTTITHNVVSSTSTENTVFKRSYANMTVGNLRTFSGDTYKAKIYMKEDGSSGEFEKIYETLVESPNELVDQNSTTGFKNIGIFPTQSIVTDFWVSSSNTFTATQDDDTLIDGVLLSGSTEPNGNSFTFETSQSYDLQKNEVYVVDFDVAFKPQNKVQSDGTTKKDAKLEVFLTGPLVSETGQEFPLGEVDLSEYDFNKVNTFTKVKQKQISDFLTHNETNTPSGSLGFRLHSGEFILSDVRLRPFSELNFSPGFFKANVPMPKPTKRGKAYDFVVEFYDANNNLAEAVAVADDIVFAGAPQVLGDGNDGILTGSVFLSNTEDSGIEFHGGSAYIRSVGYNGFERARDSGTAGFMMFSGSVSKSLNTSESYDGVGIEIISGSKGSDLGDKFLQFRTNDGDTPAVFKVQTDDFFLGGEGQFVSGSNGNIEVSSSNLHIQSNGQITGSAILFTSGKITSGVTIQGTVAADTILTPATQSGGAANTIEFASSSIDANGNARFKSGSIGGFEIDDTEISSSGLVLKSNGTITGSNFLLEGGTITNDVVIQASLAANSILTPASRSDGSATTIADASASIDDKGNAVFRSGSIGGFAIDTTTLTATNFTLDTTGKSLSLGSGNDIFIADADDGIQLGHATFNSAPFRVNMDGELVATSVAITGEVNASSGTTATSLTAIGVATASLNTTTGSLNTASSSLSLASSSFSVSASEAALTGSSQQTSLNAVGDTTASLLAASESMQKQFVLVDDNTLNLQNAKGGILSSFSDYAKFFGSASNALVTSSANGTVNYTEINDKGFLVVTGSSTASFFGNTTTIGDTSAQHISIAPDSFSIKTAANKTVLSASAAGITMSGSINAGDGTIGGFTINDTEISSSGLLMKSSGQITGSNVLFSGGTITSGVTIQGTVAADTILTPATQSGGGANTIEFASSSIDANGNARFRSGSIGGFEIDSTTLTGTNFTLDTTNKRIVLGSSNNVFIADADDGIQLGHATFGSAPFRVNMDGELTATSVTVTGNITADSGPVSQSLTALGITTGSLEAASSSLSAASESMQARFVLVNDNQLDLRNTTGGIITSFGKGAKFFGSASNALVTSSANTNYSEINDKGFLIVTGSTTASFFGNTTTIGDTTAQHISIEPDSISIKTAANKTVLSASAAGISMSGSINAGAGSIGGFTLSDNKLSSTVGTKVIELDTGNSAIVVLSGSAADADRHKVALDGARGIIEVSQSGVGVFNSGEAADFIEKDDRIVQSLPVSSTTTATGTPITSFSDGKVKNNFQMRRALVDDLFRLDNSNVAGRTDDSTKFIVQLDDNAATGGNVKGPQPTQVLFDTRKDYTSGFLNNSHVGQAIVFSDEIIMKNVSGSFVGASNTGSAQYAFQAILGRGLEAGGYTDAQMCLVDLSVDTSDVEAARQNEYVFLQARHTGSVRAQLQHDGDFVSKGNITAFGTSFLNVSDEREKKNIYQISESLDKVLELRPTKFTWKETNKQDVGFIAQEVEKVIPEIVEISKGFINVGKEREMKTISYPKLVPYLVDTIQELTKRIEKLEKKVK